MRTHKGNVTWWLVIIIAVAALAVGLVIGLKLKSTNIVSEPVVPTPSISPSISSSPSDSFSPISTADWKTYKNDTYKFSFKYPQDWVLDSNSQKRIILNSQETAKEISQSTCVGIDSPNCRNDIMIIYYEKITDVPNAGSAITFDDLFNTKPKQMVGDMGLNPPRKITFAGKNAYEINNNAIIKQDYTIYVDSNNHIYELYFGRADKNSLNSTNLIENQILSTFQFTR